MSILNEITRPNHQSAFRFNHNIRKALITSCAGVYMISDYGQGEIERNKIECRHHVDRNCWLSFTYFFICAFFHVLGTRACTQERERGKRQWCWWRGFVSLYVCVVWCQSVLCVRNWSGPFNAGVKPNCHAATLSISCLDGALAAVLFAHSAQISNIFSFHNSIHRV